MISLYLINSKIAIEEQSWDLSLDLVTNKEVVQLDFYG